MDDCTAPRGYLHIKDLAKRLGRTIPSLLAISRTHDPFFMGSPAGLLHAQWFAELWQACGYQGRTGIHLRQMHYLVVSKFPGLVTADTTIINNNGTPSK